MSNLKYLSETVVAVKQLHRAVKVRIYPNAEQSQKLSQVMGCNRWWWNYALNLCNQTYKETGLGLGRTVLNSVLPKLKQAEETKWLKDCYSQVLQSATLNLTKALKNFFEKRAKYPKFKSYNVLSCLESNPILSRYRLQPAVNLVLKL